MKKPSIIFEKKIERNNNKMQFTVFFDMQLKLGFSIERKCYIYHVSITLSPNLSLYIYTVTCREGGEWGGDDVRGMWIDVTLPSTFQNRIRFMENIFGKIFKSPFFRSIDIHPTSSCHFFLCDLSILWQCKGILSRKRNHKFKHAKAASTKPLGWIKFIFSNPTFLVSAHYCIYMYI